MTTLATYHGILLRSNYGRLFMEGYTSIKQITTGSFMKSAVIFKKLFLPACIS